MKRLVFRMIITLFLIGSGCVAYGLWVEPKQLKIRQLDFISDTYTGPALRVGLIADLHIGGLHVPPERVGDVVREMNLLQPDVVLLPGDFINSHMSHEEETDALNAAVMTGLAELEALKASAFATLGNHDHMYGAAYLTSLLTGIGVQVLQNESAIFGDLCLVGVADYDMSNPDPKAFSDCAEKAPFVLTHSPQAWGSFRDDTILAVAGHTHGGQINLPLYGRRVNATALGPEHSYGFSKLGGIDVFVSAGIGTSILPIRFRSPPEIVLITVRPKPSQAVLPDHRDR